MTAAPSVSRQADQETRERSERYAGRIRAARGSHEMHELADEIACDRTVPEGHRVRLQLIYADRCRELWPGSFRRSR